MYKRFTKYNT